MVPDNKAEEIIKNIYSNLQNRPGRIHRIALEEYVYNVAVENENKEILRATIFMKDVQDVFKNQDRNAKKNIKNALENWKIIS